MELGDRVKSGLIKGDICRGGFGGNRVRWLLNRNILDGTGKAVAGSNCGTIAVVVFAGLITYIESDFEAGSSQIDRSVDDSEGVDFDAGGIKIFGDIVWSSRVNIGNFY